MGKFYEQRPKPTFLNFQLTPWWLNIAYLAARTPLPVVTSPGVMFPKFEFNTPEGQLEYAAKISQAAIKFYLLAKKYNFELKRSQFLTVFRIFQ